MGVRLRVLVAIMLGLVVALVHGHSAALTLDPVGESIYVGDPRGLELRSPGVVTGDHEPGDNVRVYVQNIGLSGDHGTAAVRYAQGPLTFSGTRYTCVVHLGDQSSEAGSTYRVCAASGTYETCHRVRLAKQVGLPSGPRLHPPGYSD